MNEKGGGTPIRTGWWVDGKHFVFYAGTVPVDVANRLYPPPLIVTPADGQFVANVPELLIAPTIVPQPVTVALLEITSPFPNA